MKESLLGLVILIFVVGCSSPPPTIEVVPTPNIEATVEATLDIQATIRTSRHIPDDDYDPILPTPTPTYTPILTPTRVPTLVPSPTPTLVPTPTYVVIPTAVPTSGPAPTPTPTPVPTPMPTNTPSPTATPLPPSKFEGGFVMMLDSGLTSSVITFKINGIPTRETFANWYFGKMVLMDLHSDRSDTTMRDTTLSGRSDSSVPPGVVAGRAYIDGAHAPDGSVVTAWVGGEEIIEARTTVTNNPQPISLPKLVERLGRSVRPENPCTVKYKCEGRRSYNVGGGKVSDYIDSLWWYDRSEDGTFMWQFYSTDPAWRLANNITLDRCDNTYCLANWVSVNRNLRLYSENEFSYSGSGSTLTNMDGNGWNSGSSIGWPRY